MWECEVVRVWGVWVSKYEGVEVWERGDMRVWKYEGVCVVCSIVRLFLLIQCLNLQKKKAKKDLGIYSSEWCMCLLH